MANAEKEIDKLLVEKKKREALETKTAKSRTVINKTATEQDRRKRLSEECKRLGNESFSQGEYNRAKEYYSSAILECDSNPVLFTNRAQAHIKLGDFDSAIEDCKAAIKLRADFIKAQITLARALKGKKDFQKALSILELAEDNSTGFEKVIDGYRREIIKEMKEKMLEVPPMKS